MIVLLSILPEFSLVFNSFIAISNSVISFFKRVHFLRSLKLNLFLTAVVVGVVTPALYRPWFVVLVFLL